MKSNILGFQTPLPNLVAPGAKEDGAHSFVEYLTVEVVAITRTIRAIPHRMFRLQWLVDILSFITRELVYFNLIVICDLWTQFLTLLSFVKWWDESLICYVKCVKFELNCRLWIYIYEYLIEILWIIELCTVIKWKQQQIGCYTG